MFFVDAHLDLAYNALDTGRDLLLPVAELRQAERRRPVVDGTATVTFPELRRVGVGLVFGTVFVSPPSKRALEHKRKLVYRTPDEAHRFGLQELDYYHRLADEVDYLRLVGNLASLEEVVASHQEGGEPLVGIVPLMEGADPIREPAEAELWYERGLRLVGPAWSDTRYSPGAWGAGGKLTSEGRRLLEVMADLGLILDLTHMAEEASLQALESYEGVVVATHSNARALVPGQRQFSNEQIQLLAEREGVIGVVLYNAFLKAGHRAGDARQAVTIDHVVAHIDHICQVVGDAAHVGIGSDFDGGFGQDDCPTGVDGPEGLAAIAQALSERGYEQRDVEGVMGGNWLRLLRRAFGE